MKEKVKKFNELLDETINSVCTQTAGLEAFKMMDETQFKVVKTYFDLLDSTKDIFTECAKMMDEQDRKLDLLLRKLEELKLTK